MDKLSIGGVSSWVDCYHQLVGHAWAEAGLTTLAAAMTSLGEDKPIRSKPCVTIR